MLRTIGLLMVYRILLADDSGPLRLSLERFLRHIAPHGDVLTAEDGCVAINAFNASLHEGRPFDLVISDTEMPFAHGDAVLRHVRAMHPSTAAYLSSARADYGVLAERYRFNGFLKKPYDLRCLQRVVERHDPSS